MAVDPRILDVLLRYEALTTEGMTPTPEELCRDCPELLDEVKKRLAGLKVLDARLGGASPTRPATTSIPGYEIVGALGRGGMGVVHEARDLRLKRAVALKLMLAGPHATPEARARFAGEAEAVA